MGVKAALVVPTLGRSPWLTECLRALRREAGEDGEVIVVVQGDSAAAREAAGALAHRRIEVPRPLGFAAAADLGIAAAEAPWVAVVNDDAVVEAGWLAALRTALEEDPRAAAAQGVNVLAADPSRTDGWGLAWNRRLQAVQLGHGDPPPGPAAPVREVFGVSATAALFRREALLAVALPSSGAPA
ncbi:MAG: glycosyltransferase, partial [Thermoanaerobaculia bacterium]